MIELTSTLTRQECLLRLQRAAEADDWEHPEPASGDPMLVSVAGTAFTVMNASDHLGWRTFRRHFYGQIADRPGGLSITGRFRLHPAARLALTVWFGSMTGIVVLLAVANTVGGTELPAGVAGWPALLIPTLVLAAAAWLVRGGLAEARRGEPAVMEFLTHVLEARASSEA